MTPEEMIELRIGVLCDLKNVLPPGPEFGKIVNNIEILVRSHRLLLEIASEAESREVAAK